jgi:hypothetical protein
MLVERDHLSALFNRLYDRGEERFTLSHPAEEIGDLVRITLGGYEDCTVEFLSDREAYATARRDVQRNYPEKVFEDLPDANDYI